MEMPLATSIPESESAVTRADAEYEKTMAQVEDLKTKRAQIGYETALSPHGFGCLNLILTVFYLLITLILKFEKSTDYSNRSNNRC